MNFLAHDAILPGEAPALVRVASALPDLFRLLPTPPLPLLLLRALRQSASPDAHAVARGIRAHLVADATFHRHQVFLERMEGLAAELPALWPGLGEPELAGHILVEMLLDRWLVRQDAGRAERFAAAFAPEPIATAAQHGAGDPASRAALGRILSSLGASTFRQDYGDDERFARRFERAWERSGFATGAVPRGAITAAVERWAGELAPDCPALLQAVADAVQRDASGDAPAAAP